ncbi:hypothetical protein GCM10009846_01480 [Agrococcus versicolor]|uniref:DSBA-like thioredoxin domain-containing protein n=2 Tax=Agrococcus versicolor TaxID=501482 RepID=A0ABP5M8U0_9MICO
MAEVAVEEWGMTPAQWSAKSASIRAAGAAEGLEINVDTAVTFDSRPVHRILKLATSLQPEGAGDAWEVAFDAHFRRNVDLSSTEGVAELAANLGLEVAAVRDMFAGDDFAASVVDDLAVARDLGIQSVPTVRSGGRLLAGSHSVADLAAHFSLAAA